MRESSIAEPHRRGRGFPWSFFAVKTKVEVALIEVSERAAERIVEIVSGESYTGLRLGLQDGGCSG